MIVRFGAQSGHRDENPSTPAFSPNAPVAACAMKPSLILDHFPIAA
jgi:hypothetical protein